MRKRLEMAVDRTSGIPFYIQACEQIRLLIRRGALQSGDSMPTVRSLAVELGVNANTVARVYRDLQREGYLRLEQGVGTFVADATEGRAIEERDFAKIAAKARDLIRLGRRAGLGERELLQLVESLWKEGEDAER